MHKRNKRTPYQVITDRILELLESGVVGWRKPWSVKNAPRNLSTKRLYRGVNVFLLRGAGYASPWWLTYRQAKRLGGFVRKGEKSTPVVFWKVIEKRDRDADADDEDSIRRYPVLRLYRVFNVDQVEGLEGKIPDEAEIEAQPIGDAEELVGLYPDPPQIDRNRSRAFYRPSSDLVGVPPIEAFEEGAEFYSTLFHELVHSTGSPGRLSRFTGEIGSSLFGSESYSREELVAEIGATFLCSEVGIEQETIENSAAYIEGWSRALRSDPKLFVIAAAQAQKAADLICGRTPGEAAKAA